MPRASTDTVLVVSSISEYESLAGIKVMNVAYDRMSLLRNGPKLKDRRLAEVGQYGNQAVTLSFDH